MRIAFLSVFYPYRGGIAQFNAHLCEAMGQDGEVRVFNFSRQYPDFLFPGKTQYVTEQDKAMPVESTRILDSINPFSWRRTAREILRWKPDIVVFSYWMSFFAPAFGCVASALRRRGVVPCALHASSERVRPRAFARVGQGALRRRVREARRDGLRPRADG